MNPASYPGPRTLVVRCPDWSLTVLGVAPGDPALVLDAGRVAAASEAARAVGVARGQRRREAQGRCPEVAVLERDEAAEARRFEPVVAALEDVTPWVEVSRPGACAFGVRGPLRLLGGEAALLDRTAEVVGVALDVAVGPTHPGCRLGVADGRFAADLAARAAGAGIAGSLVVPVGGSPAFLASQPVGVLGRPGLADVLVRLGLTTLGAFAALSATDVVGRFGAEGQAAHRLAAGLDGTPLQVRRPPPDLAVAVDLDPPVDRIDRVAFVARALAEQFHDDLRGRGLACTRVVVEAETEHGERLARCWRDEGCSGRRPWSTGSAGSWRAGCTAHRRSGPPPGWCAWLCCPTRWYRPPAPRPGSGAGQRRPTSGRPGPSPGWWACWERGRCGCPSGGADATRWISWSWSP